MKIEFRWEGPAMHQQSAAALRRTAHFARFARPIGSERDYREAKTVLALTLRSGRGSDAGLRAEALLREIVDYEMHADSDHWDAMPGQTDHHDDDYDGPRRRRSDIGRE